MKKETDKKGALTTLAKGAVDGSGAFLGRICLPAAEEFGLLLKDKVSTWRANNAIEIVRKAEKKLNKLENNENLHAHPRLVTTAFETGSFSDNPEVQEMWAGLLASSCDEEGKDESNLLFMTILSQINSTEAIILNYLCKTANKTVSKNGFIWADNMEITVEKIIELTGITDVHRMDRELDHLRALDIISGGFNTTDDTAKVAPRALGLNMYVSCQGSKESPLEYFDVNYENSPYNLDNILNLSTLKT